MYRYYEEFFSFGLQTQLFSEEGYRHWIRDIFQNDGSRKWRLLCKRSEIVRGIKRDTAA
jgi:hypothetical protein